MYKSNTLPPQRQIQLSFANLINMSVKRAEKDNKKLRRDTEIAVALAELIAHYNALTGRDIAYSKGRHKIVSQRLKEGYTVEDFKLICDHKYHEWKDDDKMKRYIEIETFLREEHIQKYLERAKEWRIPSENFNQLTDQQLSKLSDAEKGTLDMDDEINPKQFIRHMRGSQPDSTKRQILIYCPNELK